MIVVMAKSATKCPAQFYLITPPTLLATALVIKPLSAPSTDQTYTAHKYGDPDGSVQDT